MATKTDWPYDADQHDPLTEHRIAVVGTPYPWWHYLVALYDGSLHGDTKNPRPTEREMQMLASFLEEYKTRWYNQRYLAELAERPFDVDGGANGITFQKWGEDDWGYRQRTWEYGPQFWPGPGWYRKEYGEHSGARAHSLTELLDHIYSRGDTEVRPAWVEWKAAHPDVFGTD